MKEKRHLLPILFTGLAVLVLSLGLYLWAVDGLFRDWAAPTYCDPISVCVPDSDSTLEIREYTGFRFSGAEFYLLPATGGELSLGSVSTNEYTPFQKGEYRLDWLEDGVCVHYQYTAGGSMEDKSISYTWS